MADVLRNVKQILRADRQRVRRAPLWVHGSDGAAARVSEGSLIRLERDRRGGLRVFQGSALQRPPAAPSQPAEDAFEAQPIEVSTTQAFDAQAAADADAIDSEPMPTVDPTAELLGRAKARRPRSRLAPMPVASEPAPPVRGKRAAAPPVRVRKRPRRQRNRDPEAGERNRLPPTATTISATAEQRSYARERATKRAPGSSCGHGAAPYRSNSTSTPNAPNNTAIDNAAPTRRVNARFCPTRATIGRSIDRARGGNATPHRWPPPLATVFPPRPGSPRMRQHWRSTRLRPPG